MSKKESCLYGGSFDPFHVGHAEIITYLANRFSRVFILPSNNWMKKSHKYSIDDRISALQDFCKQFSNVTVLSWAKDWKDHESTYLVLKRIEKEFGEAVRPVIGSDNLPSLHLWKNYDEIKKYSFLVLKRDDNTLPAIEIVDLKSKYLDINSTQLRQKLDFSKIPKESHKYFK